MTAIVLGNAQIADIARAAYEVQRVFAATMLADHSRKPWDQAPELQRISVQNSVRAYCADPKHALKDAGSDLPREQQAADCLFLAVCDALTARSR